LALEFHYHPLSSYCWKALIALYELHTPFTPVTVNLGDPVERAEYLKLSPLGKIPALRDTRTGDEVWETTIIIEYLDQHHPGPTPLIPADRDAALSVRFWDRFYDFYVHNAFTKIVADRLRADGTSDTFTVQRARAELNQSYDLLDGELADRTWAAGEHFTLADCAAAPALFYADLIEPIGDGRPALTAYWERLRKRSSVARAIEEARPVFQFYPASPEERARLKAMGYE
jgi:glutathione S-transferase